MKRKVRGEETKGEPRKRKDKGKYPMSRGKGGGREQTSSEGKGVGA